MQVPVEAGARDAERGVVEIVAGLAELQARAGRVRAGETGAALVPAAGLARTAAGSTLALEPALARDIVTAVGRALPRRA